VVPATGSDPDSWLFRDLATSKPDVADHR